MFIDINKIIVKDRIRKDFGDITELAQDIKDNGLINPPVVTPDYELIAGERRLRAMIQLGYPRIPVNIMTVRDYEHKLTLEINENESRKEFNKLERIAYTEKLIELKKLRGLNSDLTKREIINEASKEAGIGTRDQYFKEKYISENATGELLDQWNKGDISTHKAYIELKQQNERLEHQLNIERNKPPKIVDKTDYSKINYLESDLRKKESALTYTQKELENTKKQMELYKQGTKEYELLTKEIESLSSERNNLNNILASSRELSIFAKEIDTLLQTKLAGLKYAPFIEALGDKDIILTNFVKVINAVENWIIDIKKLLPNQNIITVEYTE